MQEDILPLVLILLIFSTKPAEFSLALETIFSVSEARIFQNSIAYRRSVQMKTEAC